MIQDLVQDLNLRSDKNFLLGNLGSGNILINEWQLNEIIKHCMNQTKPQLQSNWECEC